jgi:hypothetical protein
MLDGMMDRTSSLILTTKTGHVFEKGYFERRWDEAMKAANLQQIHLPGIDEPVDLHFHDLRGTAVTLLSEANCSPQQIATITGIHSEPSIESWSVIWPEREGLGEQAISNFENSPPTKFANRLIAVGMKEEQKTANQLQTGTNANVTTKRKKAIAIG